MQEFFVNIYIIFTFKRAHLIKATLLFRTIQKFGIQLIALVSLFKSGSLS